MMGPLLFGLATVLGAVCAAMSLAQLRAVAGVAPSAAELQARLQRLPSEERAGALLEAAAPGGWEAELARRLLADATLPERIAAVNDALAEAEHRLRVGAGWPRSAVRIGAIGTLLFAAVAYPTAGGTWSLANLAAGGALLLVSLEAGRRAARRAPAARAEIDRLVDVVAGDLVAANGGEGASGTRRVGRWRRRRRG